MINKSDTTINISFDPHFHLFWFRFRLYDEQGRLATVPPAYNPNLIPDELERVRIKPGETATGFLSPKMHYQIPPARY